MEFFSSFGFLKPIAEILGTLITIFVGGTLTIAVLWAVSIYANLIKEIRLLRSKK